MLAQLTAGAFGTGWPFYVSNLAVTAGARARGEHELRRAARAAEPARQGPPHAPRVLPARREAVYRIGIVALALAAALLLVGVNAETNGLIPLFAIGVFIGFTISQSVSSALVPGPPGALAAARDPQRRPAR